MNDLQIKKYKNKLNKLGKFVSDHTGPFKESEIIDWISECVNVFYEIGVDSVIIKHFLDHYSTRTIEVVIEPHITFPGTKDKIERITAIGPFHEEMPSLYLGDKAYKTGNYVLSGSFYYAKVAFSSAKRVLESKIEEKRIVPSWLVEQISENDKIKHLASSLELIETKYEQIDTDSLITESVTLLDSILNLDPVLKQKRNIGCKLSSLIDDKKQENIFGVDGDLLRGLNCGRIIRNKKVIHKNMPMKYNLPFLVATSFAYLVIFFTECAILNGKVVKIEDKK